ncbi:RraA family protein [Streptomyces akebiae]|uniref:RraA family protein n=1 Tax=Streptomyces akebiae TaxID=2865673 RepID=UPI0021758681|nr:hypothetical protein [Streptomyces akebiae]
MVEAVVVEAPAGLRAGRRGTADLADEHGDQPRVREEQFTSYRAVHSFAGPVRTISSPDDDALLHELLRTPGDGCVAVVDGGGALHAELLGDVMAERARDNGWAGVVVYGAVRDSALLAGLDTRVVRRRHVHSP